MAIDASLTVMRSTGAPDEIINDLIAQRIEAEQDFEVWPEYHDAVSCFMRLTQQWRVSAMGDYLGLDIGAIKTVMEVLRIDDQPTVMDQVLIMSQAACQEIKAIRSEQK